MENDDYNYTLYRRGGSLSNNTRDFNRAQVSYVHDANNAINRRVELNLTLDNEAAKGIFTLIKKGLQVK